MSRSQIGSVIYGLITMIPLQRIAQMYIFGALGTFSHHRKISKHTNALKMLGLFQKIYSTIPNPLPEMVRGF
jgi:predicted alpha/beta hydrolase